ncbi:MAG: ATP-binding cassette domain-containing protein [Betaproteobacteria bacterium]|nr:ATP-binding cassette domain-containing protein [Betaproteobacteria bacterium]
MTASATEPILSLRDVSKAFGGIQAVDTCTFDVRPGRITGLIGPNGAGKTTIFNLITGFLRADTGTIRYKGADIVGRSPHRVESLGVVRTFQHLRLWGKMTVLENVLVGCPTPVGENVLTLFLRPGRVRAEEAAARERAMEALDFFGLAGRAHELAEDLAYPEQKLLSMARMYATEADLLLLDEPTSGLDADSLSRIVPIVRKLVERGKTVLLIEHNMELISQLSDDVVFLHQGHVLASGKPADITRDPALTEIYFGV